MLALSFQSSCLRFWSSWDNRPTSSDQPHILLQFLKLLSCGLAGEPRLQMRRFLGAQRSVGTRAVWGLCLGKGERGPESDQVSGRKMSDSFERSLRCPGQKLQWSSEGPLPADQELFVPCPL